MNILHKAAQLFILGFQGTSITTDHHIWKDIEERNLGGVILFDQLLALKSKKNNIETAEQLQTLTGKLQGLAKTPLLICIDQEGGRVCRLKPKHGFPPQPSLEELGKKNDLSFTETIARTTSGALQYAGINTNFAPVVDLNANPENPVIGSLGRSFSATPEKITAHALAWIKGARDNNIISCLKHFPGHGSSSVDSHLNFVDISNSWDKNELFPYTKLIGENVEMIMAGHLFNSKLDEKYPASLSPFILRELLRKKLGFNGVIVSDDLQMGAIINYYGQEEAIQLAIRGGNDLIILGNNLIHDEQLLPKAMQAVENGLNKGVILPEQIDEAYSRVHKLKLKYLKEKNHGQR